MTLLHFFLTFNALDDVLKPSPCIRLDDVRVWVPGSNESEQKEKPLLGLDELGDRLKTAETIASSGRYHCTGTDAYSPFHL